MFRAEALDRNPLVAKNIDELVFPREAICHPVVESVAIPEACAFGDEFLGTANSQSFDSDYDPGALGTHG